MIPEGNLQRGDKIVIPQDDLCVITWETNSGEFPNSNEEFTIPTLFNAADNSNSLGDDTSLPGEIFTDMNVWSTGTHENESFDPTEKTRSESTNDRIDEQQSSEGSDTIVPEVSDDENDDMIVENESPRGGKYYLRHNPNHNFTDEDRY